MNELINWIDEGWKHTNQELASESYRSIIRLKEVEAGTENHTEKVTPKAAAGNVNRKNWNTGDINTEMTNTKNINTENVSEKGPLLEDTDA